MSRRQSIDQDRTLHLPRACSNLARTVLAYPRDRRHWSRLRHELRLPRGATSRPTAGGRDPGQSQRPFATGDKRPAGEKRAKRRYDVLRPPLYGDCARDPLRLPRWESIVVPEDFCRPTREASWKMVIERAVPDARWPRGSARRPPRRYPAFSPPTLSPPCERSRVSPHDLRAACFAG